MLEVEREDVLEIEKECALEIGRGTGLTSCESRRLRPISATAA